MVSNLTCGEIFSPVNSKNDINRNSLDYTNVMSYMLKMKISQNLLHQKALVTIVQVGLY